jgi:hypothetical protein
MSAPWRLGAAVTAATAALAVLGVLAVYRARSAAGELELLHAQGGTLLSGDRGEKGAFWDDEDKTWASSPSGATAAAAPTLRVALAAPPVGAAVTDGAFWDDEDQLWAARPSGAKARRLVALADSAHGVEAAKRRHKDMRSDIDKLAAAAKDLVKATQTEVSNALPRSLARRRSTLNSPSPRHPAHAKKSEQTYKGVDLNHVYAKAYEAAFSAAYDGTYKTELGKAEQKLWQQVQKGRKARQELDALERDKELALAKSRSVLAAHSTKGTGKGGGKGIAVMQQKKAVWDSVSLGGEEHMRSGPEFTNEQEKYGPLERHCSTGNCEPLESSGVNVDAWKGLMFDNIYRTVPLPRFDPSEDPVTKRAMAQRTGRYAAYDRGRKDDGVTWGGSVENEPLKDPTWERLSKHGVNTGSAYWGKEGDLYRALPLPGFDNTQFDHVNHMGKSPYVTAEDHLQQNRDQDAKLEEAGVVVNRYPAAFSNKGYSTMDGVPDRLVKTDAIPTFRKDGLAAQEAPTFWLGDDADTQGNVPQWQETSEGMEERGVPATQLQAHILTKKVSAPCLIFSVSATDLRIFLSSDT